ncbi:hypothetical protein [Chitiniphilus eburneus]|uniref:Uncharacterized protein n=1 Tax=Chitiniphilus eburneus TaxID=2571148 RepID=A0A4U0QC83_9NEIS|nr:hypothetical protein [Chitiniphilus eburneus]TJZ79031.1 hypothetical protein FAZ21_01730 [Chitiniphilus eburneus]
MTDLDDSVSPLFNKMDALMARHRGSSASGPQDEHIPVLTDILDDDIPVLTEVVAAAAPAPQPAPAADNSGLMFHPDDFLPPPRAPVPPPVVTPAPATAAPAVFLDLPLLDLDALLTDPAPFGPAEETAMPQGAALEADVAPAETAETVDYPTLVWEDDATPAPEPSIAAAPIESFEVDEEITASPSVAGFEVIEHGDEYAFDFPEVAAQAEAEHTEPEQVPAPANLAPSQREFQTASIPPADREAPYIAPVPDSRAIEAEPVPQATAPTTWTVPAPAETPAEDHWASAADLRVELAAEPAIEFDLNAFIAAPAPVMAPPQAQPAIEPPQPTEPPPPPKLDVATIEELTAGVAAHLAVDIAMEVDRLSRQHFKTLMSTLYAEAAHTLATQIGHELEARLAPRVAELVRDELRRRQLLD